ncbi:MAG: hypothetical protein AB1716_21305 [Planctomycetota bacterium]
MIDATSNPPPPDAPAARDALPAGLYCPDCGYDLRSLTSDRCPECGFDLTPIRAPESQIPWTRRRARGRLRAYWQTVEFVLRQPKKLCLEIARPVSYADARSFRWVTWAHAAVAIVAATAGLLVWAALTRLERPTPWVDPSDAPWAAIVSIIGSSASPLSAVRTLISGSQSPDFWWLLAGVLFVVLAGLALAPSVTAHFFRPRDWDRERQDRAVALSYYAWGPLALLLPALLLIALVFTVLFGVLLALAALVAVPLRLVILTRLTLRRGRIVAWARLMLMAALVVATVGLLLLFPAGVFYLLVIGYSLC